MKQNKLLCPRTKKEDDKLINQRIKKIIKEKWNESHL